MDDLERRLQVLNKYYNNIRNTKSVIRTIESYHSSIFIKIILIYLKKNTKITEDEFNQLAINANRKTRWIFPGMGRAALTGKSNCWLRQYQEAYGPIIYLNNNEWYLTDVWKHILSNTNL